jgi:putative peptidoglycan lipid II flippase
MQKSSVNRRIFSAVVIVGVLSFAARFVGAGRDLLVATRFGTGDQAEAFLAAYTLPLFAVQVIAGSFTAAVVPTFIEVRERQGREAAQRLLSSAVALGFGLLLVTALVMGALSSQLMLLLGSHFSPEKQALTRRLFLELLPLVLIGGTGLMWSVLLNAGEKFALSALAPAVTPLVPLALLVAFGAKFGVELVVVGTLIGALGEAALVGAGLVAQGWRPWPKWHGYSPSVRQIVGQYLPMVAGASIMASNPIVDQAMAALLGPGNVSSLNYGNKVVGLVVQLGAMSLSTAVLPHFARMVAVGEWAQLRATFRTYTRLTLAVTVPLTLALIVLSHPIVRLVFQRGAFVAADTEVVARVQALSLLQVPFYVAATLVVRLLSSLKANHVLMWGAVVNVAVNVSLDYLLMRRMGVAGIALSTAAVYAVSYTFLRINLGLRLSRRAQNAEQTTDE